MNDISIGIVNAVKEIKSAIVRAQSRVAANANAEMLSLYFGIGRYVSYKTQTEKWGTGVIDTISQQLQKEMPGLRGFGARNIRNMRQFYEKWAEDLIWQTPSAKLESESKKGETHPSAPANNDLSAVDGIVWPSPTAKLETAGGMTVTVAEFLSISFSHHMEILSGAKPLEERLFYVHEAALRHFNLEQLRDSIKRDDFHHRGAMPSNFAATIPDVALARKTLAMFRDEYLLDFVNLDDIEATDGEDVDERVVEKSIVANIEWTASYPDIPFVVIPGNHDFYPIAHLLFKEQGIDWKYGFSPNVHFLGDRGTEVNGVKFYGTPWVPIISYSWAFEGEPDTLKGWFSKIPADLDVLVTHSPPRIPGSDVDRSLQTDSEHFGSPELTEAIMEKRPRLVFCGHIHTGQHGGADFGTGRIYNVSRLDERYEVAYEPTWVEV